MFFLKMTAATFCTASFNNNFWKKIILIIFWVKLFCDGYYDA